MAGMVRFIALLVYVISAMAGTAWSAHASKQAPANQATQAPAQAPAEDKKVLGDVVRVDQKSKSLVVKTKSGEMKFSASDAGLVGYGSIADIKAGDKIAVLYEEKNGKLNAKTIANHSAMTKMGHPPAK